MSPERITTTFEAMNTPPQVPYKDYLSDATQALEAAISTEKKDGLDVAVDQYRVAADKFNEAIMKQPVSSERELKKHRDDPFLWLQLGRCLAKEIESGDVQPYRNPYEPVLDESGEILEMRLHDRRKELSENVSKIFTEAWDGVMHAPVADEIKINSGIVAADGLRIVHDISQAETVVEEVDQLLEPLEDTSSKVVELFKPSESFKQSTDHRLYMARELANQAVLNLTTASQELLLAA
ncbi:MAG TPA: hypothetical protein VN778_02100 [Verrucomicrobiae bacterium]|nr:hypothetical protein [Verrucomicrobiae bacterium]